MDAQLGLRVSPVLLRLSLSVGGAKNGGTFILGAAHADWIAASGESLALFLGLGIGSLRYGLLVDGPSHSTLAWLPEAGLILGHRRGLGRLVFSAAAVIPSASPPLLDRDRIAAPAIIGSLVASL